MQTWVRSIIPVLVAISVSVLVGCGDPTVRATPSPAIERALVLGGGNVTGLAWEIGLIKGLKDGGIDVSEPDVVVGTSAGSIAGAMLRSGHDVDRSYQRAITPISSSAAANTFQYDPAYAQRIQDLVRTASEMSPAVRAEIGRLAVAAASVTPEDVYVRQMARFMGSPEAWPIEPLKISAGDVADGSIRFFDRTQGVPIERAVAASAAVPGEIAPVTVGDRRYMDGYVGGLNIDGAVRAKRILVLAPYGRPEWNQREVEAARSRGSQVLLITPDADARTLLGPRGTGEFTKRGAIADDAIRQAATVAATVKAFWANG